MSRLLKRFILLSVLLNLLMAGVIIGHCFFKAHPYHTIAEVSRALPDDMRVRFDESMKHVEQDTGEMRQQLSDTRKQAINLLRADPFDKKAYLAEIEKSKKLRSDIMQHMANEIADMTAQFTPAQREKMADIWVNTRIQPPYWPVK